MVSCFITVDNRKLVKFNGCSFDLPAIRTCPKSGNCKSMCYAVKLSRIYKGYKAKTERNLKLSKALDAKSFLTVIGREIEDSKCKFFRIHGGGDFYDQRYLNKWLNLMKNFPHIEFYAYSKSLHLNFGKLKNFTLIKSFGGKLDHLIKKSDYQSLIIPKHAEIPKGYVLGKDNDLWWLKAKRVALPKH